MAADEDGSSSDGDDRDGGNGHEQISGPPGGHAHIHLQGHNASVTLSGNHNKVQGGGGNVHVTGTQTNHDTIVLGHGNDHVFLTGNHNTVTLSGGNDQVALIGNHEHITLGNGNDHVLVDGNHSKITVGHGNDIIALGPDSKHDTIKVGQGHDIITTSLGDDHNTFKLDGSTTSLLLHGLHNAVFLNGGHDRIVDTVVPAGGGDHLTLHVGSLSGTVDISHFSTAHGLVDLAADLGFASAAAAAAFANSHSDGHGGSLLVFAHGQGSIDFAGVAPGSLHASNFQIG